MAKILLPSTEEMPKIPYLRYIELRVQNGDVKEGFVLYIARMGSLPDVYEKIEKGKTREIRFTEDRIYVHVGEDEKGNFVFYVPFSLSLERAIKQISAYLRSWIEITLP